MLPRLVTLTMLISFRKICTHGLRAFLPRTRSTFHCDRSFTNDPSLRSCFLHLHSAHSYERFPPSVASSLIRLSSTSSSRSSDENDFRGVVSVDAHLSQLRTRGRITAEEAQSINDALLDSSKNDDTTKSIINKSIDIYLSRKQRRTETNEQPIGNPGFYVRSIVRKELSEMEKKNNRGHKLVRPAARNSNAALLNLEPLMHSNEIGKNELNDSCLLALSRCPTAVADNALKAYAKQRRRREMNGTEKISVPSSYVMAVLRNTMTDTSSTSPPSAMDSPDSSGVKHETTPIIENKSANSMENTTPPALMKMPARSKFAGVSTEPVRKVTPLQTPDQTQKILADRIEQEKGKTAVNMDHVDKCLSYLGKLEQPVKQLAGVGPKTESAFHKVGIYTLRDLLWKFPRLFIDRSKLHESIHDIADGEVGTFRLVVHADKARSNSVTCTDEAGNDVDVAFFYGRSRQGMVMASTAMKNLCRKNLDSMVVSGKVKHSNQKCELFNPDIVISPEEADAILGIEAVYALSAGLTQKKVMTAVGDALVVAGELLSLLPESLPQDVLKELGWPKLVDALVLAHKPMSIAESGPNSPARQRIAFEELSMQQAQLALTRWKLKHHGVDVKTKEVYPSWRDDSSIVSAAVSSLPFELTPSQVQCLDEMWDDAIGESSNGRMVRILQGDVGSGKTVLAYLLGLGCIESRQGGGRVVALLCPTQLLAAQHQKTIGDFGARLQKRSNLKIHVELLTGNVIGDSRNQLLKRLESVNDNDAVFLIGTHALTTPEIVEKLKQLPSMTADATKGGLALAIVDEEQRFGVRQRQALTGCAAHSLYMSATPIPRSISLMKSGLMDFTLLQGEPRPVETTIVSSDKLEKVLTILEKKIESGSKCFWVLPRIMRSKVEHGEDDDDSHKSNVIERYNSLINILGKERVCYIHGRMPEMEREEQLARFADPSSKVAVLVGTTVIEVGIDIPDVNILCVENADRFGLSQLHQLRGRIGRTGSRSDLKCNCLLLSSGTNVANQEVDSLSRLQVLQKTNKCEEIADADFMLRGPGEMLGFRQSGIKNGFTVHPANHWDLLKVASQFGRSFLERPSNSNSSNTDPPVNNALQQLLTEGRISPFYNQTNASSAEGFALRLMMALFGEWKNDECNTLDAINTLQILDASKGQLSENDESIDAKLAALAQAFISSAENPSELVEQSLPSKPHVSAVKSQVPTENRLNLRRDDVIFLVLDVETTGLDEKSCHVIQLAAKVLGSEDEKDLFSEYILPPIERVPEKIEELTGITDSFLRHGGYDSALGKERDSAREFRDVFLEFQSFCDDRAEGREIVFVAHNSKFDIRMINGELMRWRVSEHASTAPLLGDIFTCSFDTLHLFRAGKWWRSNSRPSSFSLSALHSHVLNEPIENSHNAVGDINALERLLLSNQFKGWETIANKIQVPFINVD